MAVVYRHIRLDKNEPFYIGIGKSENRAYSRAHRNDHWKRVVALADYEVEILFEDIGWDEAKDKEREFIALYGRVNSGTGCLVNQTDGGDGALGRVVSKATRERIGSKRVGIKLSEEHKAKINPRGRVFGPYSEERKQTLRKPKSEQGRLNMSLAKKGKPKSEAWLAAMRPIWEKRKKAI
jgi:hypothetical protein